MAIVNKPAALKIKLFLLFVFVGTLVHEKETA